MQFERKPQTVEAVQYTRPITEEFKQFMGDLFIGEQKVPRYYNKWCAALLTTRKHGLRDPWFLQPGHWYVRVNENHNFTMPDDEFQRTYVQAEGESN